MTTFACPYALLLPLCAMEGRARVGRLTLLRETIPSQRSLAAESFSVTGRRGSTISDAPAALFVVSSEEKGKRPC
jgi:hypothetical protein